MAAITNLSSQQERFSVACRRIVPFQLRELIVVVWYQTLKYESSMKARDNSSSSSG